MPDFPNYAQLRDRDTNEILRFASGQMRLEVKGKDVSFAVDAAPVGIEQSCRSDAGWIHRAGTNLYWSDRFLSALKPLESTNQIIAQCAPVVTFGGNQPARMWSKSGPREIPAVSDTDRFHFTSNQEGRLVRFPDLLFETHDGGRTFSPSANNAVDPAAWLDGLKQRNRSDFKLGKFDEYGQPRESAIIELIISSWLERSAKSNVEAALDGLRLGDGTWVRSMALGDRHFLAFRSPSGQVSTMTIEGSSHLFAWGDKLLAVLDRRDAYLPKISVPPFRVIYPVPATLPAPPVPVVDVVVDPLGRHIVAKSNDDDWQSLPSVKDQRGSWLFDGHAWQFRTELRGFVSAISGDLVQRQLSVARLSDPQLTPLDLGVEPKSIRNLTLQAEGVSFVHALDPANSDSKTEFVRVRFDMRGRRHSTSVPLPFAVRSVGFADSQNGTALDSERVIHTTTDGGKTWSTLIESNSYDSIICHPSACRLGAGLLFTKEEGPYIPVVAALPPPPPLPQETTSTSDYHSGFNETVEITDYFDCRSKKSPKINHANSDAAEGATESDGAKRPANVQLTGLDASGTFLFEAPLTDPSAAALLSSVDHPFIIPKLISRQFVVYVRYEDATHDRRGFILHADGHLEELCIESACDVTQVPLPSGGALLSVTKGHYVDVLELSPEGQTVARRWFMRRFSPGNDPGIERFTHGSSGAGYAMRAGNEWLIFTLTAGTQPRSVPANQSSTYSVCNGPPEADAVTIFGDESPEVFVDGKRAAVDNHPHWPSYSTAFGTTELGRKHKCLRRVTTSTPFAAHLEAEGGRLHGMAALWSLVSNGKQVTEVVKHVEVDCIAKRASPKVNQGK